MATFDNAQVTHCTSHNTMYRLRSGSETGLGGYTEAEAIVLPGAGGASDLCTLDMAFEG